MLAVCLARFSEWCAQAFYAACQGLLYILCYRLEGLMLPSHGWTPGARSPPSAADACTPTVQTLKDLFATSIPQLLGHW